jgi:hypothetical protein
MRFSSLATALLLSLTPLTGLSAQISAYDWTFKGNPGGSGQVFADSLLVVGADNGDTQSGHVSWLETSTPVQLHVKVTCQYSTTDTGEWDAPVWVLDGVEHLAPPDPAGSFGYYPTGFYFLEFDVPAGHTFGLGIMTEDAIEGPGIGSFKDFVATPVTWTGFGGGIDPRPWFTSTSVEAGDSMCGLGDVDGDGVRELVVDQDEVRIHSGASGALLLTVPGLLASDVADAGDVNADGVPDFVVGTAKPASFDGRVEVRSGSDGALVFGVDGLSPDGWLGITVAGLGDVDGDGYDDVAAGAPFALSNQGQVLVLGGPDGHVLHDFHGPGGGAQFGRDITAIDDVDLDGVRDLAVTLVGATIPLTRVAVWSGSTGAPLSLATESQAVTGLNSSVIASAGDFDGDGRGDVAWWINPVSPQGGGKVSVRSGLTGLELAGWPITGTVQLASVTGGDMNGDGSSDVAFSMVSLSGPYVVGPVVRIYSGTAAHALLEELPLPAFIEHGALVAAFGDVDLDGATDLAIGPWEQDGSLQVLHALDGKGMPLLNGLGSLDAGTLATLALSHGKPNAPFVLVLGFSILGAPFKGGTLVPQPSLLLPATTNSDGRAVFNATWPALPGPVNFWTQAWLPDADGPHGFTASDALAGSHP